MAKTVVTQIMFRRFEVTTGNNPDRSADFNCLAFLRGLLCCRITGFPCAMAVPASAGFGLSGLIFYAAEDFGRLVHEIESCRSAVWCRRPNKVQNIFALTDCRAETVLCHVVQRL
jgi:hypothetical protein